MIPIPEIKTFVVAVAVAVVANRGWGQSEAGTLKNISTVEMQQSGWLGLQQPARQQAAVQTMNEIWSTTTVSQKNQNKTMVPQ